MSPKRRFAVVLAIALVLMLAALWFARSGSEEPGKAHESPAATDSTGPSLSAKAPDPAKTLESTAEGIRGVVTDLARNGLAGARVASFQIPWRSRLGPDNRPVEVAGEQTLTAADGAFRLPAPSGVASLRATAEGFATRVVESCRAGTHVVIALAPAAAITVLALDEGGDAVPGATVRLWALRTWQAPSPGVESSGKTGADGRCAFKDLPKGSWAMLDVVHEVLGSPPGRRIEIPPAGPAEVTVVLPRGRTVSGRVVDADSGDPIPGARVGMGWTIRRAVMTDPRGEFEFHGWTGVGSFQLHAEAPGYQNAQAIVAARDRVDFRLVRGASVAGRVVAGSGLPLSGARIELSGLDGPVPQLRFTMSGEDGRFEILGALRDFIQTLVVTADGYGRTSLDLAVPDVERYDVGDVVVAPGRAVEGVVLGPDGKPAEDVKVNLEGSNRDRGRLLPPGTEPLAGGGFRNQRTTLTDALGRFRFDDLAPGSYEVAASPRGRRGVSTRVEIHDAEDPRAIVLRLSGSRSLRVRVRDPDGRPLPGFEVRAECTDPYYLAVTTDSAGEAVLWDDGPFQSVELWGEEDWIPPDRRALGAEESTVEFVVRPAGHASGVVLGTDGRPVGPSVALTVTQGGMPVLQGSASSPGLAFTDYEGRFRVVVPRGETIEVSASETMLDDGTVVGGRLEGVAEGQAGLELRLRPLAQDRALRVLVLAPDGTPAADVQVYVRVAGRNVAGANLRTGTDGRAELSALPESGGHLFATPLAESPGHGRWLPLAVPIRPRGQEETLRFREARVVQGTVRRADGSEVSGALVTVRRDGAIDPAVPVDTEGRFVLLLDPTDARDVHLAAATVDAKSAWVALPAGDEPLVLVLLKP